MRQIRARKPLTDKDGEVRVLFVHDVKRFRPAAEILPTSLLAKLHIRSIAGGASRRRLLPLRPRGRRGSGGGGGDSRAVADTHLTLPALRAGPLPLPPEGRRGPFVGL